MRSLFQALFGIIAVMSGAVVAYAWIVFLIKWLVDVLHYDLPFWSSFGSNLFLFVLVEVFAVVLFLLFGGLSAAMMDIGRTKRRNDRWRN